VTTKSCPVIPQSTAFGFSYNVNNFPASVPSFEVRLAPFREGFRAIFDNVAKNPDGRPAAPYRVRFFNEPPNEIRKQSVERGADVDMEDYQETSTHQNDSHQSGESLANVTVQPRLRQLMKSWKKPLLSSMLELRTQHCPPTFIARR